ncbi:hypothetical protein K523DRAFT_302347 [Schizophyllum commune Tattone D]|nr:hypothetical protein K523DRAFT_302347 [Schizophyllum commune Tattone D]
MSNNERLPQELKDTIVGCLYASGDTRSLATCALAHRSLYNTSQILLFRDISIREPAPASCLLRTLRDRPHLGAYVHSLCVEELERSNQWIYRDESLTGILHETPELRELYLHPSSVFYGALAAETRVALSKAVERPSLQTLSLACIIALPMAFFKHLSHVRDLRLSWMLLQDVEVPQTSTRVKLTDLTLSLSGSSFVLFSLLCRRESDHMIEIDNLRSLRLEIDSSHGWQEDAADIIAHCSKTLQSLELACLGNMEFLIPRMHIRGKLHRLKLLALRDISKAYIDTYGSLDWLRQLLALTPGVTHIAIQIKLNRHPLSLLSRILAPMSDILTGDNAPSTLRSVSFTLSGCHPFEEDKLKDLGDLKRGVLAPLAAKVDVTIGPTLSYRDVEPPLLSLDLLDD